MPPSIRSPPTAGRRSGVRANARVRAGRGLDRLQLALAGNARRDFLAEIAADPLAPVGPPGPFVLRGALQPFIGRVGQGIVGPEAVLVRSRRIHDAGDVTRAGEDEARV